MKYKKLILTGLLSSAISLGSMTMAFGQDTYYRVQPGDSYWLIGQRYNVTAGKLMELNNANGNTFLYVGQNLIIAKNETQIHKVQSGDTFWLISQKYGVELNLLMAANNATPHTILHIGDQVKIPAKPQVATMQANGNKAEYLDWWSQAKNVLPNGAVFKIIDFNTGKSFMAKRTAGTNHADVETLSLADTNKMKEIWGGSFNWMKRPVIVEYNGRRLAASAAGMPHAGNDKAPGGQHSSWRSGDYAAGYNLDWVKNNGMDGVFDLHFPNSTRHSNNTVDQDHQKNIKIAAGIK